MTKKNANIKELIASAIKFSDSEERIMDNLGSLTLTSNTANSLKHNLRRLIRGSTKDTLHIRTSSGYAVFAMLSTLTLPITADDIVNVFLDTTTNLKTSADEISPGGLIKVNSIKQIIDSITVVDKDGFFAIDDVGLSPNMARAKPTRNLIQTLRRVIKKESDDSFRINTLSGQVIRDWADLPSGSTADDLFTAATSVISITTSLVGSSQSAGISSSSLLAIVNTIAKKTGVGSMSIDDIGNPLLSFSKEKKLYDIFNKIITIGPEEVVISTLAGEAMKEISDLETSTTAATIAALIAEVL